MEVLPEEVFSQNDPNIDPITMSYEVISRTHGLTSTLRNALLSKEGFSEQAVTSTLWQIESNLITLNKILENWRGLHDEMAGSIKSLKEKNVTG